MRIAVAVFALLAAANATVFFKEQFLDGGKSSLLSFGFLFASFMFRFPSSTLNGAAFTLWCPLM